MFNLPHKFSLMIFTLLLSGLSHADEKFDQLITKTLQTYGGEAIIASTRAIKQVGTTYSRSRNATGDIFRAYEYPNKLRIAINYGDKGSELRLLNGEIAYDQSRLAQPAMRAAMILQAARLDLPRIILENKANIRDLGMNSAQVPVQTHLIEIPLTPALKITAEIDPATGHILKSTGSGNLDGMRVNFATAYEDFRMVDGHLVAFNEEHYAMGSNVGHTQLEKVEFIKGWDVPMFQPEI